MTKVGATLRKHRERRKLTLAEVAESTKIRQHYLSAIERGEHSELPGEVFTKGYIRAYAESLGLDAPALLGDYERERAPAEEPSDREILERLAEKQGLAPSHRGRGLRAALIGLSVVAIAAVGGWALLRERRDVSPVRETPTAVETPTVPVEMPPVSVETTTPEAVPAPAMAPASATATAHETPAASSPLTVSTLEVAEFGVGTDVVDRKLVGESERFNEGDEVWFWTRVLGGKPGDAVRHVWIHEGRSSTVMDLDIGGAHWRTQSRLNLAAGSSGAWTVEARDADGRVLARATFTCE